MYYFREYSDLDYDIIKSWNDNASVDTLEQSLLPHKGVIISGDDSDLISAHLLFTGTGLAILWVSFNPKLTAYLIKKNELMHCVANWARKVCISGGCKKILIANPKHRIKGSHVSLINIIRDAGFEDLNGTGYLYKNVL